MDDQSLDRLFSGDLTKLPPLPKRVVRLFISSTFTDMTLERNSLMERVYPRLKKYCREKHALDFQVVDMRWGVRDEATDDHQTVNLCSREISICQRMSLGPTFVALLGDKYGFRPLCNRIKSTEYRALRRGLIELDINTEFLDTWYKEDLNAVPAEYVLQPISSILKNFANKSEPELQAFDQRIWQAIQERLHQLLMIGSSRLVQQGRMSENERLMKYSISVTEREVIEGCLDVDNAKAQCLVYVRSIADLLTQSEKCLTSLSSPSNLSSLQQPETPSPNGGTDHESGDRKDSQSSRKASLKLGEDTITLTTIGAQNASERRLDRSRRLLGRYIDLCHRDETWKVDEDAQEALLNLKEVKLERKLRSNGRNLTRFEVTWNERDGLSLNKEEHKHYLQELTEHFYSNIVAMIRRSSKSEQIRVTGLVGEVLQHSNYAKHLNQTFFGRQAELETIRDFILNPISSLPMFVYGIGGVGKTSVLAQVATLARDWILQRGNLAAGPVDENRWDQKPCIMMRFCGTTPSSSSMLGTLTSVCRQLQYNFYQYGPFSGFLSDGDSLANSNGPHPLYKSLPDDFVRLVFVFRQLLDNCQHELHRQRLFLIILDSVERLSSPAESSLDVQYSWLTSIARLPPNVRLIVSCSSETSVESESPEDFKYLKQHFLKVHGELQDRLKQSNNEAPLALLHIKPLSFESSISLVQCCLDNAGRMLTRQQWNLVEKSLNCCTRPIFVKLIFGELINWKSYSLQNDSRGLSFGSSLLEQSNPTGLDLMDSEDLKRLIEDSGDESDEFRCQVLSMEQQWLNYLDYRQRKGQSLIDSANFEDRKEDEPVVIKLDGVGSTRGDGSISSGPSRNLCHLSSTIEDAICQLFARVELQHGYILTKHSLSYITAARNGVCENELEDVLSLDDIVLDDVFQYHLPPVRRIPPLLWTRIRNDLQDYLSERDADGIVINWHHSQFRKAAQKRYLSDVHHVEHIHSTLADYFAGKWADKPKPFRCTKQQIQMAAEQLESAVQQSIRNSQSADPSGPRASVSGGSRLGRGSASTRTGVSFSARSRLRSSDQHDQRLQWMQAKADRRVPQQPLSFELSETRETEDKLDYENQGAKKRRSERRYNHRKLSELPHHLLRSRRFLDLANEVLFNYKWLFAALDATGLQSLLSDFDEAHKVLEESLKKMVSNSDEGLEVSVVRQDIELSSIREELDGGSLKMIISELVVLRSAIRLSCSALHFDSQMLAPQLLGRLLSHVHQQLRSSNVESTEGAKHLSQLLEQCDRDGSEHCSLLPVAQYLQSPNGLQLSSLEGHSFAVMAMSMAADQRHLLAVSNKFIMWDLSTGETSREVDPKIGGAIMRQLKMGNNNEYALAYTSDQEILVLDLLTQQVVRFSHPALKDQQIAGMELIDKLGATRFLVWTKSDWFSLRVVNLELNGLSTPMDPQRISLELEYWTTLRCVTGFQEEILSIKQDTSKSMAFVERRDATDDQVQLLTIEILQDSNKWLLNGWNDSMFAISLSLSSDLKQLVLCNRGGDIYLHRRRKRCWSKGKFLWSSRSCNPGLIDSKTVSSIRIDEDSVPIAFELKSQGLSANSSTNSQVDYTEEGMFDCKSVASDLEDELTNVNLLSQKEVGKLQLQSECKTHASNKVFSLQSIQLFFARKILILQLPLAIGSSKCLQFPENVRNISTQVNRCQMKTVTLQEYLVASFTTRLLIYSIEAEQLLKSIEAHDRRIMQLAPLLSDSFRFGTSPGSISRAHELSFASASMDKTVKIWNLSNLNKDSRGPDRLGGPIQSLSVCLQRPLAACVSRGQLALWNWRTLRILVRLTAADLGESDGQEARLVRCRLSINGRHLAAATLRHVYLLAVDSLQRLPDNGDPTGASTETPVGMQACGQRLPAAGIVSKLAFFHQDSRLLVALECNAMAEEERHSLETTTTNADSSGLPEVARAQLTCRLIILCLSVPDNLTLFTVDALSPARRLEPSGRSGSIRRSQRAAGLPVITRDRSHIVYAAYETSGSSSRPKSSREHRKASGLLQPTLSLLVRSARDGKLVRTINLPELDTAAEQFTRLKALGQRDNRFAIVALLDEDRGSCLLIDTLAGQLIGRARDWGGVLSSDGLFGLSLPRGDSSSGSLKLLESRRFSAIRTLLSSETLGESLAGASSGELWGVCGFTRPSDAYVFCCLASRLLLVRLHDCRLVANYKLPAHATAVKRATDECLVLGLADGALVTLALADPQNGDSLTKLAQLPSRRSR